MHDTSLTNAKFFFDTYQNSIRSNTEKVKVIEIGSQDVNGTIRSVCPADFDYVGLDFQDAKGVDIVITDPYKLPFANESVDVVVSNSCFEHSELFWVLFLEVLRVLKPTGLFYLNAPSNGAYHRYPVDCWRFYPDSGHALILWARRNGIDSLLLESYTSHKKMDIWNDFIAVFLKERKFEHKFPARIVEKISNFDNGWTSKSNYLLNHQPFPEDLRSPQF